MPSALRKSKLSPAVHHSYPLGRLFGMTEKQKAAYPEEASRTKTHVWGSDEEIGEGDWNLR